MRRFDKGLHKINYKIAKSEVIPIKGGVDNPISKDENQWLPVSVLSFLFDCSKQTIRLLYLDNKIRGVSYPGAPLLFSLTDLKSIIDRNTYSHKRSTQESSSPQ